jgi:hypothetical protein
MKLPILLFHRVHRRRGAGRTRWFVSAWFNRSTWCCKYLCVIEILTDTHGGLFARPSLQARFGHYRKTLRRRGWLLIVQEDRSRAWYRSNVRDLRNQARVDREGNASDCAWYRTVSPIIALAIRVLVCFNSKRAVDQFSWLVWQKYLILFHRRGREIDIILAMSLVYSYLHIDIFFSRFFRVSTFTMRGIFFLLTE